MVETGAADEPQTVRLRITRSLALLASGEAGHGARGSEGDSMKRSREVMLLAAAMATASALGFLLGWLLTQSSR
jgi:hypothetical protein